MSGHYHAGGMLVFKCSSWLNSSGEHCQPNWVERDHAVAFVIESLRRRFRELVDPEAFKTEVRKALEASQVNRSEMQTRLEAAKVKLANVRRQADRTMRMVIDAASDTEAEALEGAYKDKRREALDAEGEVRRLEADMVAVGMPVGDEVERTIGYLRDLDRMLEDMPEDSLRSLFDTVGARLEVRFTANTGTGRRRRLPVGGTLRFGVGVTGSALIAPGNTRPSASAEGLAAKNIGFG